MIINNIDDVVFLVFSSNFFKLSYKISLLKNQFVTLFLPNFHKIFKRSRLILHTSEDVKFVPYVLNFLTQKGLKIPRNQLQTTKFANISARASYL